MGQGDCLELQRDTEVTPRASGSTSMAGVMPPVPAIPDTPACYLSACLIVVEVHEAPGVLFDLTSIHKSSGKVNAIAHISRAASPLPAFSLVVVALLLTVTATVAQVTLAAGSSDSMCHACRGDGVCEGSLTTPCGERQYIWVMRPSSSEPGGHRGYSSPTVGSVPAFSELATH